MRRCVSAIFVIFTLTASLADAALPAFRKWSDKKGETRLARFIRLEQGNVVLEDKNEAVFTIALEKLSVADMDHLQSHHVPNRRAALTHLPSPEEFLEKAELHARQVLQKRERFLAILKVAEFQAETTGVYTQCLATLRALYKELDDAEKLSVTPAFMRFLIRGKHYHEAEYYIFAPKVTAQPVPNKAPAPLAHIAQNAQTANANPEFHPLQRVHLYKILVEGLILHEEFKRIDRILDIIQDTADEMSRATKDAIYGEVAVLEAGMGRAEEAYATIARIQAVPVKTVAYCKMIPLLKGTSREKDIPDLLAHSYRLVTRRIDDAQTVQELVDAADMLCAFIPAYLSCRSLISSDECLATLKKLIPRVPAAKRPALAQCLMDLYVKLGDRPAARVVAQQFFPDGIRFLMRLVDQEIAEENMSEAEKTLVAVRGMISALKRPEQQLPYSLQWAQKVQEIGKPKEATIVLLKAQQAIPKIRNQSTRQTAYHRLVLGYISLNELAVAKKAARNEQDWRRKSEYYTQIVIRHLENEEFFSAYAYLVGITDHGHAAAALLKFAQAAAAASP